MAAIVDRLNALRELMREASYAALVIPRADEYLGEYLPQHNERLHWASGFTGSAGAAIVLADRAAMFVDGRYTVQVRNEVDPALFEFHHLVDEPPMAWLAKQLDSGARVACDPRMHSLRWYRDSSAQLAERGIALVPDSDNLIDRCWTGRPAPQISPAILLDERYSGASSLAKRQQLAEGLRDRHLDAALVFAPDSVSWLLNLRGTDIPCLPVLQSFALLHSDSRCTVFVEPGRLPDGVEEHVGDGVEFLTEQAAADYLQGLGECRVLADPDGANAWTQMAIEAGGATLVAGADPVLIPKACKNPVEVQGARDAHLRDAVAAVRFLAWLDCEVAEGRLHDEDALAEQLASCRARNAHYHGPSFDTISAAGGNAAMCHYNHRNAPAPGVLSMDSVYLVDSGGQYSDGTTDITRTVAIGDPGDDIRRMFTLVLKGHIALDQARFPPGTTGTQLDALARQYLWREGFDYDHGTGHGVGAFLSVHEGPQRIAKAYNAFALRPGMIVSNEPGYYRDSAFGIRCENLLVVRPAETAGEIPVLEFEALTLVPFDRRLIDMALLTGEEQAWIDTYHRRVAQHVGPLLDGDALAWLEQATRPLAA